MADPHVADSAFDAASPTLGSGTLLADDDESYLSTDEPWYADAGISHG